jgi:hypothetical protein
MTTRAPIQTRIPRARRIESVFDPGQDSPVLSQLRGQDKFFGPAGQGPRYDYPNPRGRQYPVSLRFWSNSLQQTTLVPSASQPPLKGYVWPNPRGPVPSIALRTWVEPLKLNLIGQDNFFGGPGGGGPMFEIPNPNIAKSRAVALMQWHTNLLESTLSVTGPSTPIAGSDTWALSFTDSGLPSVTVPGSYTELNPWTLLPGAIHIYEYVSAPGTLPIDTADTWALTWTETPTDTIFVDTWDVWSIKWTEAPAALSIIQTFTANDTWSLTWLDFGNVFSGAPVTPSVTDTWSLSFDELTLVAATVDATDTWSLTFTDSGAVDVVSDLKTASDDWALTFQLETAFFSTVIELPILGSDEWKLTFAEVSNIVPFASDVGISRVLTMRAINRVLRKQ